MCMVKRATLLLKINKLHKATYQSQVTAPVFSYTSCVVHDSLPSGAALKLKSKIARVITGGLLWWLQYNVTIVDIFIIF